MFFCQNSAVQLHEMLTQNAAEKLFFRIVNQFVYKVQQIYRRNAYAIFVFIDARANERWYEKKRDRQALL